MVSIVIPIYNQEKYISDCFDSILKQTYKNYEVIIINDGSTDKSKEICLRYSKKYKNFRYYEQKNSGVSVARNLGIKYSYGEWIMFVDPDDLLDKNILSKLSVKIDNSVDIISCCCQVFNDKSNFLCANHFFEKSYVFKSNNEKIELIKQLFYVKYRQPQKAYTGIGVPWGKLYRRSMLKDNQIMFNSSLRRMQDNAFNMYVFWLSKSIIYLDEPLYRYRIENISKYYNASYKPNLYENYVKLQEERWEFLNNSNLVDNYEVKNFFYEDAISQIIDIFNSYIFNKNNPDSYLQRKEKAINILNLNKAHYKEAIEKLSIFNVTNKKHGMILAIFKIKKFFILNCIWNIRNIVKK